MTYPYSLSSPSSRFTRQIAWNSPWSCICLSMYRYVAGGASKPVSSLSTTISSRICPGCVDEPLLDLLLELLGLVHRRVVGLAEVIGQHPPVDLVLPQPLGQPFAGFSFEMSPGCGW